MKRVPWLLFTVVASVLILAGCTPATVPEASDGEAEKTTLEYIFNPPSGGEGASCLVETVVDVFNEESDTIFVNAVAQPEAWNATRTALASGAGPDIVVTPGPSFVYELAESGQLLPLDDFVDLHNWDEIFVPWALSLGRVGDKLYSVPHEQETLVLYYNKTLFEENGWEPPATIDEMMALADTIAAADIIPFAHANAEWRPANEWFVGEFLNHVAGPQKVYDALSGNLAWDDEAFVLAISYLNDLQQAGHFMGGLDRYYTTTSDDFHTALATGEAAMSIEGTWAAQNYIDIFFTDANGGNEWDWVPVPSTSGEAIFDVGMGSTWSINANSEHPEEAAEFLTYFFSPETQARLMQNCGNAPAPVLLEAEALEGVDERIARIFSNLAESSAAGNYGYTTWTFWPPKSDVYIYEEIEKVWAGDMTPEEYLMGLNELFQEELAEGAIPPIPER